jgi:hypothetical protein
MGSTKFHIVFDLDNVIVEPLQFDADKIIEHATSVLGKAFIKDHLIIAYNFPHMVFPGFYGLWQWLDTLGVNIIIFSSGISERNHELVEKLIEKSFNKSSRQDRQIINVFSREHCIDTTIMPRCGLLQKIISVANNLNSSLSDAARSVQVDFEQEEFRRFFPYPGKKNRQYYVDGLENLQLFDKSLKFYFEWDKLAEK